MPRTIGHIKKNKKTPKQIKEEFLAAIEDLVSVSKACKKVNIARSTIYDWLRKDKKFKEAFDLSCEVGTGALEDEAFRRAYDGTLKPVFYQGKKVGSMKEYSDTLMIVLLKARAPEKYKERNQTSLVGDKENPLNVNQIVKFEVIEVMPSPVPIAESEEDVNV